MKVLVLGASGFVGKWVVIKIKQFKPQAKIFETSLSSGVDLREEVQAQGLFRKIRPDLVINCAAYVGGIQYGFLYPADIYRNNMRMVVNIFEACKDFKVKRVIQPISNCAYPAAEKFFKEENFWSGIMDDSVLAYGMVRKMSWVGSWAYNKQYKLDTISLVLSNMYGPGDHFDEVRSHALGALIKKIVDAKLKGAGEVVIWGTGKPVREWLYVEDGAEALARAMDIQPQTDIINIGTGKGISIKELAVYIRKIVGWKGKFIFDVEKPDGAAIKTVNGEKGEKLLGWKPGISLEQGIKKTVDYYLSLKGK